MAFGGFGRLGSAFGGAFGGRGGMTTTGGLGPTGGAAQTIGNRMNKGGQQSPWGQMGQAGSQMMPGGPGQMKGPQPQEMRGGFGRPPVGFAPDPSYGQRLQDWQNQPLTGYSDPKNPGGMMPEGYQPPQSRGPMQGGGGFGHFGQFPERSPMQGGGMGGGMQPPWMNMQGGGMGPSGGFMQRLMQQQQPPQQPPPSGGVSAQIGQRMY